MMSRRKNRPTVKQIELANRLRAKRLERGLSLQEVADKVGISKVTLQRYETLDIVNIPSNNIEKLAEIYLTTPGYLMGWTPSLKVSELAEEYGSKRPDEKIDIYKELQGATVLFNGYEYEMDEDKRKKIASYVKFALSDEDGEK